MAKHLHIVTHDIPWPVDYGGVVDLFYKIKALQQLGISIHLHCFTNGTAEQKILNNYCVSVNYYPRQTGIPALSLRLPYIVQSRSDPALLKNLQQDNYPVLLEGIHCTYFLQAGQLKNRKVFVRLHNVEYKYYRQLAKNENNLIRKTYFTIESSLLKKYESLLARKAAFWAVSLEDVETYKRDFHADQIHFMPVFLPWEEVNSSTARGSFCLYHGNLAINENVKVAEWLIKKVFNDAELPFLIAGKNPPAELQHLAKKNPNIRIVANPPENEMQELIQRAQVNILPSFNNTGVKLKLLNALYNGKHCLVNKAAVKGSGLESYCDFAETAAEFKLMIKQLFAEDLSEEKIRQRNTGLKSLHNTEHNAGKLIAWIY